MAWINQLLQHKLSELITMIASGHAENQMKAIHVIDLKGYSVCMLFNDIVSTSIPGLI